MQRMKPEPPDVTADALRVAAVAAGLDNSQPMLTPDDLLALWRLQQLPVAVQQQRRTSGSWLRLQARAAGLTREALAAQLGVDAVAIAQIECGVALPDTLTPVGMACYCVLLTDEFTSLGEVAEQLAIVCGLDDQPEFLLPARGAAPMDTHVCEDSELAGDASVWSFLLVWLRFLGVLQRQRSLTFRVYAAPQTQIALFDQLDLTAADWRDHAVPAGEDPAAAPLAQYVITDVLHVDTAAVTGAAGHHATGAPIALPVQRYLAGMEPVFERHYTAVLPATATGRPAAGASVYVESRQIFAEQVDELGRSVLNVRPRDCAPRWASAAADTRWTVQLTAPAYASSAISAQPRCVVTGPSGSGKTTFLVALARELTRHLRDANQQLPPGWEEPKVPIFCSIWRLLGYNVEHAYEAPLAQLRAALVVPDVPDDEVIREELYQLVLAGDALLVFDGLDRVVPSGGQRSHVTRQTLIRLMSQLADLIPETTTIVITSDQHITSQLTAAADGAAGSHWQTLRLRPLSRAQMQAAITTLATGASTQVRTWLRALGATLGSTPPLHELARHPLYFGLLLQLAALGETIADVQSASQLLTRYRTATAHHWMARVADRLMQKQADIARRQPLLTAIWATFKRYVAARQRAEPPYPPFSPSAMRSIIRRCQTAGETLTPHDRDIIAAALCEDNPLLGREIDGTYNLVSTTFLWEEPESSPVE